MSAQTSSPGAPHRRRRIVIGVAAAATLAAVILLGLSLLGGDKGISLADAAANIEGESIRGRFDLEITGPEAYTFSGTSISTADQTASRIEGTLTPDGEQPIAPDVENLGEEPVLGTRATHFKGSVDAAELAERSEGGTAKQMAAMLKAADLEIPMDVWVTGDGLPKLMRMNMEMGTTTMRMEIEVLEYGVDVDVQPPPAATVVDESELDG
jgi:hypothetical protein